MEGTVTGPGDGSMVRLHGPDLERLLGGGGRFVLYKHSPSCGICVWTREHMEGFARRHPDVPVYWLDVIGQRPLAREAARLLDVPHASPQAMVVEDGAAIWDASHMGVTADAVERAWRTTGGR